ncbi:MAG: hypothetical protein QXK51_08775 [Candidatus Methanomethylicia archaeon]
MDSFLNKISFNRLIQYPQDAGSIVVSIGKMTPGFNPYGGWNGLEAFINNVIGIAGKHSNSLVKYVRSFSNIQQLYSDIMNIPGIGPVIALQIIRELRYADLINLSIGGLGLPPANPVIRVIQRTKLIPSIQGMRWG